MQSGFPVVKEITDEIRALAGGAGSNRGTGGMATKIKAAEIANSQGIPCCVVSGEDPHILYHLFVRGGDWNHFRIILKKEHYMKALKKSICLFLCLGMLSLCTACSGEEKAISEKELMQQGMELVEQMDTLAESRRLYPEHDKQ